MTEKNYRRIALLALVTLVLSGCTTVPEQLEGAYPDISPARVEPAVFGSNVRWGGVIVDTKNNENSTCFEILSRELGKYMRPKVEDKTAGRFIACKPGFHDPEVFAKGREVTTTGTIRNIQVKQVDHFNYRYPVLDVSELVLWEKREDVLVYSGFHDPFYSPYYWGRPYGRYGYGYGYGFGYGYPYHGFGHQSGTVRVRQTTPEPSEILSQD